MSAKKNAVVIGATGNLGSAIASALRDAGYEVDATWTDPQRPDAASSASYVNMPKHIDVAVYAAGINLVKPVHEITDEEWDKMMGTNLTGAFYFARAAFEGLKAAKGIFVTISSMNSLFPYPNRAAYSTTKAGIEGLTRQLGVEWGEHGITTHSIRLGPLSKLMKTTTVNPKMLDAVKKRLPLHTLIEPEVVASYILWLAKDGRTATTATVTDFDGGYTANAAPVIS